ncbi:MAG: YheT family hydrolase [Gammaproteobacteria bacterium]
MLPEAVPEFAPTGWIANRHLQSCLPSSPFRRRLLRRKAVSIVAVSRDLVLDCGAGVRLHSWYAPQPRDAAAPPRGLVVLIHGWEGAGDSSYMLSSAIRMYAAGWDVVRLHLRDHGPSHHLNEDLFHSNRLPEVVGAVARLAELFPELPLCLAGFSLGGNFALRVAARADAVGIPLARVMAVCPVLDPASTLDAMEDGPGLYQRYFMAKWRRSLDTKARLFPQRYSFGDLRRFRSLRAMTDFVVRDFSEYDDLATYLAGYAIVGDVLAPIRVPTLLVAAADDPVIPARDLPRLARPASLRVLETERGGHCGFLPSFGAMSWIDEQMLRWFEPAATRPARHS